MFNSNVSPKRVVKAAPRERPPTKYISAHK